MARHCNSALWALRFVVIFGTTTGFIRGFGVTSAPTIRRWHQIPPQRSARRRANVDNTPPLHQGSKTRGSSVSIFPRYRAGSLASDLGDGEHAGAASAVSDGHEEARTPRHVAFVCDGNSRWAERRHLPASVGHVMGGDAATSTVKNLQARGVKICTFYGFSTENWSRTAREVNDIWSAVEQTARAFRRKAMEDNVQIRILGDLDDDRVPDSLREVLVRLEEDTGGRGDKWDEDCMTVCLAVNYGGRRDILNASLQLAEALSRGEISPDEVDENTFGKYLCTSGLPDPDLIVRTGGEQRLSNFLLWDQAYSELYFTDVLWPDFNMQCVTEALAWYSGRSRRFGGRQRLH